MWTDFFDNIFLINLPSRIDRLQEAGSELSRYRIACELVPAVPYDPGWYGLYLTYKSIMEKCINKTSLFLEDDAMFLRDPAPVMDSCIEQLLFNKDAWNIFYLGVNTHAPFSRFHAPNILPIGNVDGRSTHAIAFSPHGISLLADALTGAEPIDMSIVNKIQRGEGKCFCSYPMLATQRGGYSDIDKKFDSMSYIAERFNNNVRHLL